jgi:hypothetical protein
MADGHYLAVVGDHAQKNYREVSGYSSSHQNCAAAVLSNCRTGGADDHRAVRVDRGRLYADGHDWITCDAMA